MPHRYFLTGYKSSGTISALSADLMVWRCLMPFCFFEWLIDLMFGQVPVPCSLCYPPPRLTYKGHPASLQRGRPTETGQQILDPNSWKRGNIWSNVHKVGSTPRHTDRLTDSRKVALTLTIHRPCHRSVGTQERELSVWVYWPPGGSSVLTLLLAWYIIISWYYLLHENHLAFMISML
jgi:hypothetical protein